MFRKQNDNEKLDSLLETLLNDLQNDHEIAHTDEYAGAVDQYIKLKQLRDDKSGRSFSPDALLAAGVNIATVLVIVGYEQKNLLASKAFSFVRRL